MAASGLVIMTIAAVTLTALRAVRPELKFSRKLNRMRTQNNPE